MRMINDFISFTTLESISRYLLQTRLLYARGP
jgi:hypothetical protein